MLQTLFIIGFFIFAMYNIIIFSTYGEPKSISDTYYYLGFNKTETSLIKHGEECQLRDMSCKKFNKKKAAIFQIWLTVVAMLCLPYTLEITEGYWFQFLCFFAIASLIYVAAAPNFKFNDMQNKIHTIAASISAICAMTVIILLGYWYVIFMILGIMLGIALNEYSKQKAYESRIIDVSTESFYDFLKKRSILYWGEILCFGSFFCTIVLKIFL